MQPKLKSCSSHVWWPLKYDQTGVTFLIPVPLGNPSPGETHEFLPSSSTQRASNCKAAGFSLLAKMCKLVSTKVKVGTSWEYIFHGKAIKGLLTTWQPCLERWSCPAEEDAPEIYWAHQTQCLEYSLHCHKSLTPFACSHPLRHCTISIQFQVCAFSHCYVPKDEVHLRCQEWWQEAWRRLGLSVRHKSCLPESHMHAHACTPNHEITVQGWMWRSFQKVGQAIQFKERHPNRLPNAPWRMRNLKWDFVFIDSLISSSTK